MPALTRRQYDYDYDTRSSWDNWVRWLILGLIIVGGILIFFVLSWASARRRRRMGFQPYRGTGWTVRHGPVQYTGYNNNNNNQPAPPYGAQDTQPYYPTQHPPAYNEMTNMSSPQAGKDYAGDQNYYAPPPNPPPGAHIK